MALVTEIILASVTIIMGVFNIVQLALQKRSQSAFLIELATAILKSHGDGNLEALEELLAKHTPKRQGLVD